MLEDGTLLSGGGAEIKAWDSMNYFKRVKERAVDCSLHLLADLERAKLAILV